MYTQMKLFAIIGGAVAIGIGSALSFVPLVINDIPMALRIGITLAGIALFVLLGIKTARHSWNTAHKLQTLTYDWYRQSNPTHTHSHGVSCNNCGNNRIHVRALMGRLYHREHVCTQCGKTLYYSPETKV